MRSLECELSLLQKPDGSATFQQGETKVMCAVYGPAEVKVNREILDKTTLDCILKLKVGLPGVKEKALEEVITNTCGQITLVKLHPRSAVQIVLQVMQDSGSLLACLINTACMAMINAGIPMQCTILAVCCAISKNDEFIIDPTSSEEEEACCILTFAFESRHFELVSSHTIGCFSIDEYFKGLQLSRMSAKEVAAFQRESIVRFLSKETPSVEEEDVEEMVESGTE